MSLSPYLLAVALVFWAWHSGPWWLGLALAALVELPGRLHWQWALDVRDRQRVADLCTLLILLTGTYLYITEARLGSAILVLMQWSPALLFPLLAAQLASSPRGVEPSVLFLSLRRRAAGRSPLIDLRPAYLVICVLGAAMQPAHAESFLLSLGVLTGWALWPYRSRRRPGWWWGALLGASVTMAMGLGVGLQRAQMQVGDWLVGYLSEWMNSSLDPYRATTAIGDVGRLKLSERIVLRVRSEQLPGNSMLLRSATYDRYFQGSWLAGRSPFQPLSRDRRGWQVSATGGHEHRLAVDMALDEGRGILPLPGDASILQGLAGANLSRSRYGVVKVLEGPGMARYRVAFGGGAYADAAPGKTDLRVLPADREVMARWLRGLNLDGVPASVLPERLAALFENRFRYSLRLRSPPSGGHALEHFLFQSRAGHCEYFATAAVLALRQAGIPARYARGWSVREYSDLEHAYVVRARHAHAWVLAWIDGAWRDFDPTPSRWAALEAAQRPWWTPLLDVWQRLGYLAAGLEAGDGAQRSYLPWLLLPLIMLLAWRLSRRGRVRPGKVRQAPVAVDSLFSPVERVLAGRDWPRRPHETLLEWNRRLRRGGVCALEDLEPAMRLYYRERFHPMGLTPGQRRQMRQAVADWLARNR